MTLSIGYAMTIEHASAEKYKSWPITICIRPNTSVPKSWEITRIYRYDKAPGSTPDFHLLILTGCQSPQGKFTPEQVAVCNLMDLLNPPATGRWAYQMHSVRKK